MSTFFKPVQPGARFPRMNHFSPESREKHINYDYVFEFPSLTFGTFCGIEEAIIEQLHDETKLIEIIRFGRIVDKVIRPLEINGPVFYEISESQTEDDLIHDKIFKHEGSGRTYSVKFCVMEEMDIRPEGYLRVRRFWHDFGVSIEIPSFILDLEEPVKPIDMSNILARLDGYIAETLSDIMLAESTVALPTSSSTAIEYLENKEKVGKSGNLMGSLAADSIEIDQPKTNLEPKHPDNQLAGELLAESIKTTEFDQEVTQTQDSVFDEDSVVDHSNDMKPKQKKSGKDRKLTKPRARIGENDKKLQDYFDKIDPSRTKLVRNAQVNSDTGVCKSHISTSSVWIKYKEDCERNMQPEVRSVRTKNTENSRFDNVASSYVLEDELERKDEREVLKKWIENFFFKHTETIHIGVTR